MDIRERHFGHIATTADDPDRVTVDIGALVRRLILFEECTIESGMLKEIPALIEVFGIDGLFKLLESGAVRIVCDAQSAGQIGQLAGTNGHHGPLPLGSYRLASVGLLEEGLERKNYVHQSLQEVHKANISFKDAKKVKVFLASRLLLYSRAAGNAGIEDTRLELRQHNPVIWAAIRHAVRIETGQDPGEEADWVVEELGGVGGFRITTNLASSNGLSIEQEHKLVERGILAVAGMNQRISLMDSFNAVTGFQANDFPLFEKKLSFLLRQLDPDVQQERFERIATVGGLPGADGLPAGVKIDVDRLLKLREESECREFRTWIRNVDSETDEEIKERFESVRSHFASAVESRTGKAVRFLVTSGAGLIPGVGIAAGPLLSAGDNFLLEKIIGKPGPATFLSKHYPSIFDQATL